MKGYYQPTVYKTMKHVIFGFPISRMCIFVCIVLLLTIFGMPACTYCYGAAPEGFQNLNKPEEMMENAMMYSNIEENLKQPIDSIDSIDMLANQSFRPDCCPSTYSTSHGCACLTDDSSNYINARGGNRT